MSLTTSAEPVEAAAAAPAPTVQEHTRAYVRRAQILSVGIASAGLMTFAYFITASHVLGPVAAKRVDVLWSIMWVVISVIYRPIEQLLSRTIAHRRAKGFAAHPLRAAMTLQALFACAFLAGALALRHELQHYAFDGSAALYWILIGGVMFYAASYFARGWLAGHQRFGLYAGLVFLESASRLAFALAVAVGIASGQSAVAVGIAAAPFVSLVVVPFALTRRRQAERTAGEGVDERQSGRRSTEFALAVAGIMLAEQALLNSSVLTVDATVKDAVLAGIVFNVLLIARAPLQLFQSIQTSLLPHLAELEATDGHDAFNHAIRRVVGAIWVFAGAVALGLLLIGPFVMSHVFGQDFSYGRAGLVAVGVGMGLHLTAATLNQAALARGQSARASAAWLAVALAFVVWTVLPVVSDPLLRVELGYAGAAGALSLLLLLLYRAGGRARGLVPTRSAA